MDHVLHVANSPSQPTYRRYYFGTNENYTDIAQHFDYPTAITDSAEIVRVELLGIRVEVAVNQVIGSPDSIAFHYYNADSTKYPVEPALASSKFLSGGLQGTARDYFLPDGLSTDITSLHGFLVGFTTFSPGSDVFVMANSYCVVANGPNDGRGERRTKVKLVSTGLWEDILVVGPPLNQDPGEDQFMLDCDAYVYPFLRITEVVFGEEPTGVQETTMSISRIFPNPATSDLNIEVRNESGAAVSLTIRDLRGKTMFTSELGNSVHIDRKIDVHSLSQGIYNISITNGFESVTQHIIISK